jgi:hypothetical protein
MNAGLCECGCGRTTKPHTRNRPEFGHVKGVPARFLRGHGWLKSHRSAVTLTCKNGHSYVPCRGGCIECRREVRRNSAKRMRAQNADRFRKLDRLRAKNPRRMEAARLRAQRWRDSHPEESREQSLRSRWKHIDRRRETAQQWMRNNPQRNLDAQNRRRARKHAATIRDVRPVDLVTMLAAQGGICFYCPAVLGADKHLEHRTPLVRGGAHAVENLCYSCPDCNRRKGTKTEAEFRALQALNAEVAA